MKFLPERKKAETSKRNLGSLQILHCLFHCWALLLRLLRQKKFDLLLHTLELLFFGIRERCVILQRKRTGVSDHAKLLIRKKALFVYQACTGSKIQLRGFVIFHEVVTGVDALPVEVPLPRHEFSARFAGTPGQHCITEIRKYLVGIFQANSFQRGCAIKDLHILFDLCSHLCHCP